MMLRTYHECTKVVTSFELQNTPIGGGHKLFNTIKIHFPRSRSNPRVRSNAHHNNLISRSSPRLIPYMSRRGGGGGGGGGLQLPLIGA